MGHDRAEPFFFSKPADALVVDGADPVYPLATTNLHHEVELVVRHRRPTERSADGPLAAT
jgi:2-keto-4-pentenoate hydratase/2-oxohepta-3-ene-1,7-dioic acid hydratase in catechol pathway